jgi:hypothetical protein
MNTGVSHHYMEEVRATKSHHYDIWASSQSHSNLFASQFLKLKKALLNQGLEHRNSTSHVPPASLTLP